MKRNREFGKSLLWVREMIAASSEDSIKTKSEDFTRKRKIGLKNTLVQILCSDRGSMESQILAMEKRTGMVRVSRAAMAASRAKVRPGFIKDLFDSSAASFLERNANHMPLFRGYRLLAVDGSKIAVRPDCDEAESFCKCNNEKSKYGRQYEISSLFDVLNHYILNVAVSRRCDEHKMAREQMEWLASNRKEPVIVVFDRGYPDAKILAYMAERGIYFVIRLSTTTFRKEQKMLGEDSGDIVTTRVWNPTNTNYYRDDEEFREYLLGHPTEVRLVRFTVGKGTVETLATNLSKAEMVADDLRTIYHLRWEVETAFRDAKQRFFLNRMTGKKIESMRLDLWASLLCANLMLMSVWEAEYDNRAKLRRKKPRTGKSGAKSRITGYHASRASTARILRHEELFAKLVMDKWVTDKILSQTERYIIARLVPERPGRSFDRIFHFDPVGYSYRS